MKTAAVQAPQTLDETLQAMRAKLTGIVPDFEIREKAELAFAINQLKQERNAVILGHNYMEPALFHSVPDYVGDSLELSRVSAETDADIILFCGVKFMAETAKILNPGKMVLIPSLQAGCSLAEGISPEDVRELKQRFPGAPVVTYVNTYASVKAEADYSCTSGNARAVLQHLLDQGHSKIVFLPDEFLARNTAAEVGVPYVAANDADAEAQAAKLDKAVIGWRARCEVHELFTVDDVHAIRKQFPDVIIVAHPECSPEVIAEVDVSGSTKKMVDYIRTSEAHRFMLLTECSMGDNIAAENPGKEMLRLCSHRCPHMALITLEQTLACLQNLEYQVELSDDLVRCARTSIDRMLAIR